MGPLIYLQLFGIGLSFGFTGPCFFSCTPFLLAYLVGKNLNWKDGLKEALIFFCARLFAYLFLGYLAGLSSVVLRRFSGSGFLGFLKPAGGIIIVALGISILLGKFPQCCGCRPSLNKTFTFFSLFALGFISGIFPCAPLVALLFEITVISRSAWEGALCALAFGLGTFIAGFIIIAGFSKAVSWFPARVLKSDFSLFVFRAICALILIFFGASFIFF
ncbi:MAG: sulfite exporter TauE/SafE family protein [Candidatus Omnitrophica bacterium]|nr:sulfite exporter TauE/SafE family protein [Candidatus Omnitrophota bacterium]